jgi:hypothetical protein
MLRAHIFLVGTLLALIFPVTGRAQYSAPGGSTYPAVGMGSGGNAYNPLGNVSPYAGNGFGSGLYDTRNGNPYVTGNNSPYATGNAVSPYRQPAQSTQPCPPDEEGWSSPGRCRPKLHVGMESTSPPTPAPLQSPQPVVPGGAAYTGPAYTPCCRPGSSACWCP